MQSNLFYCLISGLVGVSFAFAPLSTTTSTCPYRQSTPTALNVQLLDVPDHFFTVTMMGAGLTLSFTKSFARMRMEERAWEQRLEEGRRKRLEEDPTLTELDLRRREAEREWSAYGKPRMEAEKIRKEMEARERELRGSRKNRVKVMEREEDEDVEYRKNRMSDREIDEFEMEFGVDYDPYYDDPYTEDELPEGDYQVDKKYGDRVYRDGEIFYKDAETGLFYRQGARPRFIKFFKP